MRIIFMGTPDFALPSLKALVDNGYEVVAVITATDKKGGRGKKKLLQSPIKKYAVAQDIPVLQPKNLKDPEFLETLRSYKADLQVVVAFRMLPVAVWDMPPLGTINLHGSLLPKYRGAAPLNWAIIRGEQETGLTTFFLKHEIDTGDVLFTVKTPIGEDETAGELHDRLMELGGDLTLRTVQAIASGDYTPKPQADTAATSAPKIFHDTCQIDFNQPTEVVHNFIRGLSPYPAAWTTLDGLKLKILRTRKEINSEAADLVAGQFDTNSKSYLKIACQDGFVQILEVQLQGRKRMATQDFLNGYDMESSTKQAGS